MARSWCRSPFVGTFERAADGRVGGDVERSGAERLAGPWDARVPWAVRAAVSGRAMIAYPSIAYWCVEPSVGRGLQEVTDQERGPNHPRYSRRNGARLQLEKVRWGRRGDSGSVECLCCAKKAADAAMTEAQGASEDVKKANDGVEKVSRCVDEIEGKGNRLERQVRKRRRCTYRSARLLAFAAQEPLGRCGWVALTSHVRMF